MELIERDLAHIWHPCSQMKDFESVPPVTVAKAMGSYLELSDGRQLIDVTSSWWCKSLGHNHPRIKQAVIKQMECYEHVIMPNTCQQVLVALSEKLCELTPHLNKVFYASEGSCAVEIAMKMALKEAGVSPVDIDYINAHGTGTKLNDAAETRATKLVFGEGAYKIPMSSIKSMIGHLACAAGAVEAVAAVMTIQDDIIPPTINYEIPDPECVPSMMVEVEPAKLIRDIFFITNTIFS